MNDIEGKVLLVKIAKIMAKEEGFFSLHELAAHVSENQYFYQRLHLENIQRLAYYRRAQFLSGAATIATLGIYLLFYERPMPPSEITADSYEVVRKPELLLPKEVYARRLTTGHMMHIMNTLVEEEFFTTTGEYPGTVYHPTEKLWEVST
jgi:hypothetical protein